PFAVTGTISYTFFTGGDCETGTPHAAGSGNKSSSEGPLMAGSYAFHATFTNDPNYQDTTSDCEPLTVNKADTTTTTQVHDAAHHNITGQWVSAGTIVHDSATVTSTNTSFTIGGNVTYTLYQGVFPTGTQLGSSETVAVGTESTPKASLAA